MANRDYEVGYRKPPKHTRFKKGQSGNSQGRPKRSHDGNMREVFNDLMKEMIPIRQGDRITRISARDAILRTLLKEGLVGKMSALKALLQIMEKTSPMDQPIMAPTLVICPPDGPMPPMPPIYGEEEMEGKALQ